MLDYGLHHLIDDLSENVERVKSIGLQATLFTGDWSTVITQSKAWTH
jgi:hypothetical protein